MTEPTILADAALPAPPTGAGLAYRVLARKYRPTRFEELIGQDALVRTLSNAIQSGRIAQAFMLTGVRGVGKTTTARIIARALNCTRPDGGGGPTIDPCGVCDACRAIAEDRHVDVLEMDAASHTGVDDIREIIEGVRYAPVSARYKLYIIDEVHMLSKNAFNALLKTLEEPPAHVKFVFATTEIRKVPVTVLSRCQRFDLRRVDSAVLKDHFTRIASLEGATLDADAALMVARAADGSVRDGLSLLDQAIALGGTTVTAAQVRDMLGLADRARVIDLFETATTAKAADALDILAELHRVGADPLVILQDLLDLTHTLTRIKVVPETASDTAMPEAERTRGATLAAAMSMPALTRAWQLLLKGLGEVQAAPLPQQALEMVIVRMAYTADLPTPGELIRQFQNAPSQGAAAQPSPGQPSPGQPSPGQPSPGQPSPGTAGAPRGAPGGGARSLAAVGGRALAEPAPAAQPLAATATAPNATPNIAPGAVPGTLLAPMPRDFRALVQLFADRREGALYGHLWGGTHLVRMEPGRLEIRPAANAPRDLAARVGQRLSEWTGQRWLVAVTDSGGEPTLADAEKQAEAQSLAEAQAHPLVQAALHVFPGARILEVRDLAAAAQAALALEAESAAMIEGEELLYPLDDEGES